MASNHAFPTIRLYRRYYFICCLSSARHNDTGLSLTTAIANGETGTDREGKGFIVKGGWLTLLNSLGTTALSIDYLTSEDVLQDGDEADSFGFFVQQNWEAVGMDLYAVFVATTSSDRTSN